MKKFYNLEAMYDITNLLVYVLDVEQGIEQQRL